jgi:hypothetical protein
MNSTGVDIPMSHPFPLRRVATLIPDSLLHTSTEVAGELTYRLAVWDYVMRRSAGHIGDLACNSRPGGEIPVWPSN